MNSNQLRDYIRYSTKTDAQTFTDADMLLLINIAKDDLAKEIIKINEDYFGERSYRDLEEGRREYKFPLNILSNIKAVEAMLDGENWTRLDEIDLNDGYHKAMDEDVIQEAFYGKRSRFMVYRSALWVLSGDPIIDVDEGLVLWHMVYPEDITEFNDRDLVRGSVNQRGFPRQFHELIGRKVSILYKSSKPRPIPLTEREMAFEYDLVKALESIRGLNLDRSIIASYPKDDGSNY